MAHAGDISTACDPDYDDGPDAVRDIMRSGDDSDPDGVDNSTLEDIGSLLVRVAGRLVACLFSCLRVDGRSVSVEGEGRARAWAHSRQSPLGHRTGQSVGVVVVMTDIGLARVLV